MIYEINDFEGLQITLKEAGFEEKNSFIFDKQAEFGSRVVGGLDGRKLKVYDSVKGNRLLKYLRGSNPSSVHLIGTSDV
jgi:hypothetical protein